MKKFTMFLSVLMLALVLMVASPALACEGPECYDNVTSLSGASFNAFDDDSLNRNNGYQSVGAYTAGNAGGDYSAYSEGNRFDYTAGWGYGNVDPSVGATRGNNWVAVGAKVTANSIAGALAINDGGYRDAHANVYGNVYQSNGAFTSDGLGNWAAGGNQSGASYSNSDGRSYSGDWSSRWKKVYIGHWCGRDHYRYKKVWELTCKPGIIGALTTGGAETAGGTFVYSNVSGNKAVSFGATGSYSIGNAGVWGNGNMGTSAYMAGNGSYGYAYTTGTYSYNGNYFGAGATYGSSTVQMGNGSVSVHSSHTSIATGGISPR